MKRSFLIGSAWAGASSWIEQVINLAAFVAIARLIGTEQFGLGGMALAFLLLSEVVVRETLTEEIVQRETLAEGFLEASGAVLLSAGALMFVLLCAIAPIAAASYQEPLVAWLILGSAPVVLMLASSGVSTTLLRRRLAFDVLAFQAITGAIVGGIVGIGLALMDYGAWALIGQRLSMTFVNFIISVFAARWVPKKIPRREDFKLVGRLGPRVLVIKAASTITMQMPSIALGVFSGANAVAVYALAQRLLEVISTLIVGPLRTVAQSVIAEMQRRKENSSEFILEVSQFVAMLAFASFAGIAVIADPTIQLIFGAEWSAAADVVPWICVAGCVAAVVVIQESYLLAMNRARRLVQIVVWETLVGVIMILVASPFGPSAVAGALSLRAVLFLPFRTAAMLKPEKLSASIYARWVLLIPTALAISMAFVVAIWRFIALGKLPDLVYLGLAILIGVVTYAVLLIALVPAVVERARLFIQSARAEGDRNSEA